MKQLLLLILLPLISIGQAKRPISAKKQVASKVSDLPSAIAAIEKCVVKIVTPTGTGTGFFVNRDGYIITNFHVIQSVYRRTGSSAQVYLAIPNGRSNGMSFKGAFNSDEGLIVDVDSSHDLALLKLRNNPFKGELPPYRIDKDGSKYYPNFGLAGFSSKPLSDGTSIAVSGYPMDQPVLITNNGIIASVSGGNSYGTNTLFYDDDAYYADMRVNPGNSGGPVYLAKTGEIIGVAVAFIKVKSETGQLQVGNNETLQQINKLYADTKNEEIKVLIRTLIDTRFQVDYNSGLSVVIPLKYVNRILKKNYTQFE